MRAERVMSANLTRTKTEGNRYRVDALDFPCRRIRLPSGKLRGIGAKICNG